MEGVGDCEVSEEGRRKPNGSGSSVWWMLEESSEVFEIGKQEEREERPKSNGGYSWTRPEMGK